MVEDHYYKPKRQEASISTPSAPTTHHHNTDTFTEVLGSLNTDDIPVFDEKDLTDISLYEQLSY